MYAARRKFFLRFDNSLPTNSGGLIYALPPKLNSHGVPDNRRRRRRFSFELRAKECATPLRDFAADRFSGEEINGKFGRQRRVSDGVRH
jgi:hypothetical protein